MSTTTFDHRLHPRDTASGKFTETIHVDPGDISLGGPVGTVPQPAEAAEDGQWLVSDPNHDEAGDYHSGGWPHLLARFNAAAALLPSAEANRALLSRLSGDGDGPHPVTIVYRDSDGRVVVEEKDAVSVHYDEDDDLLPVMAGEPDSHLYRWVDDDIELLAVQPGCDAERAGEWWLNHVAARVPDVEPVTFDGIPDAEWTSRDAPVAAVFLLHGDLYSDDRPAGSVFLAQACDRDGVYGQLLIPGRPARQEYLYGHDFGGRMTAYTAGRLTVADIDTLPADPAEMYRRLAG